MKWIFDLKWIFSLRHCTKRKWLKDNEQENKRVHRTEGEWGQIISWLDDLQPSFQPRLTLARFFCRVLLPLFAHRSLMLAWPWASESTNPVILKSEKLKMLVSQLCPALYDPMTFSPPGSSVHGFSRQGYWSCSHFLLQGMFLTWGSSPGLLHCRKILSCLSHQGLAWGTFGVDAGWTVMNSGMPHREVFKDSTCYLRVRHYFCCQNNLCLYQHVSFHRNDRPAGWRNK